MSYTYDEETGEVTRVPLPKLTKREAEILENAEVPKEFLERIMKMNLRTEVLECPECHSKEITREIVGTEFETVCINCGYFDSSDHFINSIEGEKMSYQQDALRTESTVFNMEEGDERLLHAGIGLATESGEFLDALKKHIFYGKPLDRTNLKEEAGDLMWYIAIALDELGSSFEEVQATNIAKLRARYPEKFTEELAENRDLKTERKILED